MKKKLLDRRGAAIELAIMMMVFSIFITTIILTTALLQNEHKTKAQLGIEQDIFLEQLGEEFVDAVLNGEMSEDWCPAGYKDVTFAETTERHNFGVEETKYATCTQEGKVTQTCKSCGYVKEIKTIPMLPHNTEGVDCSADNGVCSDCGTPVPVSHNWVRQSDGGPVVSCTGEIDVLCVCVDCGTTDLIDIPMSAHSWGEWVEENATTCDQSGTRTRNCTNPYCKEEESEEIPAGHDWVIRVENIANCIKTTVYDCGRTGCKEVYTENEVCHTWDEGIVALQPSHTEDGVMTYTCGCGATDTKPIEKTKEHTFDESDSCACGAKRNHYILSVITAGKETYKLHIQGINAVENPPGIPENITDVIDSCGTVVLKIKIVWSAEDNAYKITEWSKK